MNIKTAMQKVLETLEKLALTDHQACRDILEPENTDTIIIHKFSDTVCTHQHVWTSPERHSLVQFHANGFGIKLQIETNQELAKKILQIIKEDSEVNG